jgi:hypothetical protein
MSVDVTQPMRDKLAAAGDKPILDSKFIPLKSGQAAESVLGTKGYYVSSPEDGWQLHGPFGEAPGE